jgi:hypothetical protein
VPLYVSPATADGIVWAIPARTSSSPSAPTPPSRPTGVCTSRPTAPRSAQRCAWREPRNAARGRRVHPPRRRHQDRRAAPGQPRGWPDAGRTTLANFDGRVNARFVSNMRPKGPTSANNESINIGAGPSPESRDGARVFRFQIGEPLGQILRFKQGYLTRDLGSAAVRAERAAFHKRPCPAWARHLRRSDLQSGQMPSTMTRDSAPGPLLWHRLRPVSFQIHRPLDAWRVT